MTSRLEGLQWVLLLLLSPLTKAETQKVLQVIEQGISPPHQVSSSEQLD